MTKRALLLTLVVLIGTTGLAVSAQRGGGGPGAPVDLEAFKGVTADGTVRPGLFAIRSTGVGTKPVIDAATCNSWPP